MAYTLLRIVYTIAGVRPPWMRMSVPATVRSSMLIQFSPVGTPFVFPRDATNAAVASIPAGRQAAASYGQEPIRNLCPGVLSLPPEVLVLWNAFLFQQGLALDLFDLFACKHAVRISGAKLYTT